MAAQSPGEHGHSELMRYAARGWPPLCTSTAASGRCSASQSLRRAVTEEVTGWLAEHRPDAAVEVHHGGQPLAAYLVSAE